MESYRNNWSDQQRKSILLFSESKNHWVFFDALSKRLLGVRCYHHKLKFENSQGGWLR
jgi:hypothetical protein